MPYKIKLEQFEGPLDLLLQLIEQEDMDISTVSLAAVTEQYLAYLNETEDIPLEELADFLVVAAKLLLIKSRILLPNAQIEGEEDGSDLEQQLRMYREFYEASKVLNKMVHQRHFLFPRERMAVRVDKIFNPPQGVTADRLKELFVSVLVGLEPWVNLSQEVIIKTISIRERIGNIQQLIKKRAEVSFHELLKSAKNKTEIIVTFLAVLELVKLRTIAVVQDGVFNDIKVHKVADHEADILREEAN
ncbi:MAG: segregation/condensation protein A [Patescibacteria group bacterium]|nr:segregation/condensation protein A [Patescibacteria group bacterium]MDD5715335.1 segregation/condensation protein A [Patescibacteria group bacterium]